MLVLILIFILILILILIGRVTAPMYNPYPQKSEGFVISLAVNKPYRGKQIAQGNSNTNTNVNTNINTNVYRAYEETT